MTDDHTAEAHEAEIFAQLLRDMDRATILEDALMALAVMGSYERLALVQEHTPGHYAGRVRQGGV